MSMIKLVELSMLFLDHSRKKSNLPAPANYSLDSAAEKPIVLDSCRLHDCPGQSLTPDPPGAPAASVQLRAVLR